MPTLLSGRDSQSSCELLALLQEFASIGSECLLNAQAATGQQYNLHYTCPGGDVIQCECQVINGTLQLSAMIPGDPQTEDITIATYSFLSGTI